MFLPLQRIGALALAVAATWLACTPNEAPRPPVPIPMSGAPTRPCAAGDVFSREVRPGCREEYTCDEQRRWIAHPTECVTGTATVTAPPPPPPPPPPPAVCPATMPAAGTPCETPLSCRFPRACGAAELAGETAFECDGAVWKQTSDRPCVPACTAAVAKSHNCRATPHCYVPGACVHEGCSAGAWNDGTSADNPWPCAAPPPPPSPESCRREAEGDAMLAHCKWTVGEHSYCGGAAPPPDMPRSWPGCVCNGCQNDRDCGPGGTCTSLPATSYCLPEARVCVKKEDGCFGASRTCANGCLHDGNGHGGCLPHEPPRP